MKKLLAVLATISILCPSSLAAISLKNIDITLHSVEHKIDSFKNIVKVVNWNAEHNDFINSDYMNRYLDGLPRDFYHDAVSPTSWNAGSVLTWNTTPRNDTTVVATYEDVYINRTSSKQISKTQSRTETVTEKHEFSMNLFEKICTSVENKITGKISLPLGGVEDSIDFSFGEEAGTEQSWSNTKTVTVEESIPSQEINQNPFTKLHVKYLVTKGTVDYDGIAQFKISDLISKTIRIPTFYFSSNENPERMTWNYYSINDVLKILKDEGYSDQLLSNEKNKYSLISVDNLNNPTKAVLNLPIEWSSQTSGINLEYYEEPLSKI